MKNIISSPVSPEDPLPLYINLKINNRRGPRWEGYGGSTTYEIPHLLSIAHLAITREAPDEAEYKITWDVSLDLIRKHGKVWVRLVVG